MARRLLNAQQIRDLDEALIAAYRMHYELRDRYPIADRISRPGVPAILGESLVALCAGALVGSTSEVVPGPYGVDLKISLTDGTIVLAEVKACGAQKWQEIKPRDLAGDVLIWVDFGHRYERGTGSVKVHVLRRPNRCAGLLRGKPGLDQFLSAVGRLDDFATVVFDDVEAMVRARPCQLRIAGPDSAFVERG